MLDLMALREWMLEHDVARLEIDVDAYAGAIAVVALKDESDAEVVVEMESLRAASREDVELTGFYLTGLSSALARRRRAG